MRQSIGWTARLLALLVLLAPLRAGVAGEAQQQPEAAGVEAVEAVGITVSNLDRSMEFFSRVLTFEKVSEVELAGPEIERLQGVFGLRLRRARLRLGREEIELTEYLAPRGRPMPLDTRANDRWFQHIAIIVSNMSQAYERLRRHGVEHASTGPQRLPDWNPSAGGIEAFYFRDPDGHYLELLAFPRGKGDPRWQEASDKLFLGIDHTAIVVQNTEASLGFYRDTLGLRVVGESENHGTEQEHLNNVFGARLRITALRAPSGPGIELLEYLAPRDGKPFPLDARSTDLIHWQTRLRLPDPRSTVERLLKRSVTFVSPGAISVPDGLLGFPLGALVRDPDGHAIEITGS